MDAQPALRCVGRVHPFNTDASAGPNYHPLPALTRYLNVGTEDYPFHPHGNNGSIIGRDGKELRTADGKDLSFEKFSINIGPGQTWDVLSKWYDAEELRPDANPVPVQVPQRCQPGVRHVLQRQPVPRERTARCLPAQQTLNQCGEFYIIAHNHALYQITSWGVNMTGPITYMRVDPNPSNKPGCPGS